MATTEAEVLVALRVDTTRAPVVGWFGCEYCCLYGTYSTGGNGTLSVRFSAMNCCRSCGQLILEMASPSASWLLASSFMISSWNL